MLYFFIPHENEHRLYFLTWLSKTFNGANKCKADRHDPPTWYTARIQHVYRGLHVVQKSAVLADPAIRLIVETPPVSVRISSTAYIGDGATAWQAAAGLHSNRHILNNIVKSSIANQFLLPSLRLKHTTTLFSLSDHYILSREWRVIVDQVQTNYHGGQWCYNQSGVTELLIMRDPHCGRMCFKSLGVLHS